MIERPKAAYRVHRGTLAAAVTCLLVLPATTRAADITLNEAGSTLLYPLFKVWAADYSKTHPGVTITAASTGSGDGITQAIGGTVQIGTSDAYLTDAQAKQNPQIVDIPLAISALTINYNVPGLNNVNLKLDGPTIAGIYAGTIRQWDDKAIADLNPGRKLPHQTIIPIHRADGSGDTFVFTQFLTFSTQDWEDKIGYATTVAWPSVPGGLAAPGNAGVVQTLQQTPYSITYAGVSFKDDIAKDGLGTALLKSSDGEFLLPTPDTILAAAASLGSRTPPDERLTLAFAPGANAYPLVNYEYAVVSTKQADPAVATAIQQFLLWAIAPDDANQKYLASVNFIPLPARTWELSHDQIALIK